MKPAVGYPKLYIFVIFSLILVIQTSITRGEDIHFYLDADLSHAATSSRSIEQGILTALDEIDNHLQGHAVKLIKLDHRGNSRRSLDNLKLIMADSRTLAVFGGLHSPPLLANRRFINENRLLHLIPWAAAGSITRYGGGENWIFRLSIDDTKAGEVLVRHAVKNRRARHPALLLEETGWGKSNEKTMVKALDRYGVSHTGIFWFKWGTSENSARIILREIIQSNADHILMVANAPEGKMFARAMAGFGKNKRLPFSSHWGITGGDFSQVINTQLREEIELDFLQTRFSFLSQPMSPLGQQVFNRAAAIFGDEIQTPGDIKAPAGFVHAYDLTKILIAAIGQAGLTGEIAKDRMNIRMALENLDESVPGLIKTYVYPFSMFDSRHSDAHEALSIKDFTMGRYDEKDRIILIPYPKDSIFK